MTKDVPCIMHGPCLGEGCPGCGGTGWIEFFLEPPTVTLYQAQYYKIDDTERTLYYAGFETLRQAESWYEDNLDKVELFYRNF